MILDFYDKGLWKCIIYPYKHYFNKYATYVLCYITYALYISSGGQTRRETREAGGSAGAGVR